MSSSRILLFLIVISAFSFCASFDPSDYLYSGESSSSITYTNFTINGTDYSLVKIGGKESFLLTGDQPISDNVTITQVMKDYYLKTYYPSQSELTALKDLVKAYNASRNNGELKPYPGKEEYTCREIVFVDGRVKYGSIPIVCKPDADYCNYSGILIYQYLTAQNAVPPLGSPAAFVPLIRDFSFSSYYTDYIILNITKKLNSSSEYEMYDNIKYVKSQVPALKSNLTKIEATKFTMVWKDSSKSWVTDVNHWGYCPPIDLNDSLLDKIDSAAGTILSKMGPFANYSTSSSAISASTAARIKYRSEMTNVSYYSAIYNPLSAQAADVIAFGEYSSARVSNSTLKSDLASLKSLHAKINQSIQSKDFSTIEEDLKKYPALITSVNMTAHDAFVSYNESVEAKNSADSLIFILETKELDPLARGEADRLKNATLILDASFADGLTPDNYTLITKAYGNVSSQALSILRKSRESPGSMMVLSFRSFARKVNGGIVSFMQSSGMDVSGVPEKKTLTFGGFSLIALLSLGAICTLSFLMVLARASSVMKRSFKYVLVALFLLAMLSLTTFSAFLFVYLDRTSFDANIEEFLADLGTKKSVAVIVDMNNAPYGTKESMKSCGALVASELFGKNRSSTLYYLDATGCTQVSFYKGGNTTFTKASSSCEDSAKQAETSITLNYSSTLEKPRFSSLYTSSADIAADESYYNSCPLAGIFG